MVRAEIAHTTKRGTLERKTQRKDETLLGMQDFAISIDESLKFNRYEILEGRGRVSHRTAKEKAIDEYKEFNKRQKIVSDFDKEIRKIRGEQK